ncbi:MAG: EAL domain-containing protein, partial [Pseudomonadota bacterium]|nr:EAL domain-containing protein [Pseudomonadota bacterium]
VQDVMKEPEDASLVRAIINMAHSLGLRVIAEGVEDEPQTHFLKEEGCDFCQGYFYSRPLPGLEFEDWLSTNQRVQI